MISMLISVIGYTLKTIINVAVPLIADSIKTAIRTTVISSML